MYYVYSSEDDFDSQVYSSESYDDAMQYVNYLELDRHDAAVFCDTMSVYVYQTRTGFYPGFLGGYPKYFQDQRNEKADWFKNGF